MTYTLRHRVRYRECDPMGVVYHTHYLDWFEEARTEALRSIGLAYRELEASGVIMPVSEASIRYYGSAHYDDDLAIEVTLPAPDGVRVETLYNVYRAGVERPIVTGRVVLVFVDAARKRPVGPPTLIRDVFARAGIVAPDAEASGAP